MDENIVPKRKGGRPKKVQAQPAVVESEAQKWEDEIKNQPVETPVEAAPRETKDKKREFRDAIFECAKGHKTKGFENQKPECRICHADTKITLIYEEWQRKGNDNKVNG